MHRKHFRTNGYNETMCQEVWNGTEKPLRLEGDFVSGWILGVCENKKDNLTIDLQNNSRFIIINFHGNHN